MQKLNRGVGIAGTMLFLLTPVVSGAEDLPPPPPPAESGAAPNTPAPSAPVASPPVAGAPAPGAPAAVADAVVAPPPPAVTEAAPPAGTNPPPVDVSTADDKAGAASAAEASGTNLRSGEGSNLDHFMESKNAQKFTGRPITLQVRDVDAADVFRLIGEASGFNIIMSSDITAKLTLSLTDVPWDQALDVVLHTLHLGVERNNNILRIMTLAGITAEKQEQLKAVRAAEASIPKVTKVFPINYASLGDLSGTLQKFITSGVGGSELSLTPAVVQVDSRTNSLIVRDIPDNIERIRKLIEVLDTQTPQLLIESKVVEATEGSSNSRDGKLSFGSAAGASTTQFAGFNGAADPAAALLSSATTNTSDGGIFGFSPSISFIPGIARLNAQLTLLESENQLKVISSPKFVVLNKQSATVTQSTPIGIPTTTTSGGVATTTLAIVQANLTLSATPTVTNDGSIQMNLTLTADTPLPVSGSQNAVANRNISTQVLVESGSTLVIGGVYTMNNSHSEGGFPFLRKIPILGFLFGESTDSNLRTELFFFITPRILNPKEAGLTG